MGQHPAEDKGEGKIQSKGRNILENSRGVLNSLEGQQSVEGKGTQSRGSKKSTALMLSFVSPVFRVSCLWGKRKEGGEEKD